VHIVKIGFTNSSHRGNQCQGELVHSVHFEMGAKISRTVNVGRMSVDGSRIELGNCEFSERK
jgi:hypothetical protein